MLTFMKRKRKFGICPKLCWPFPVAQGHFQSQTIMYRLGNFATVRQLVESGSDLGQVDLEKKSALHLLPDKTRDAQRTKFLLQKG